MNSIEQTEKLKQGHLGCTARTLSWPSTAKTSEFSVLQLTRHSPFCACVPSKPVRDRPMGGGGGVPPGSSNELSDAFLSTNGASSELLGETGPTFCASASLKEKARFGECGVSGRYFSTSIFLWDYLEIRRHFGPLKGKRGAGDPVSRFLGKDKAGVG